MAAGMGGLMIKCSSCGVDIDIEKMADHLCGPGLGASVSKPPPRSFNDAFSNMSVNNSAPAPFRNRPIPRPIDSYAANGPFLGRPDHAPATRTVPPNSATLPQPKSPDFALPQDSAFPRFPTRSRSPPSKLERSNTEPLESANSETTGHMKGSESVHVSSNPYASHSVSNVTISRAPAESTLPSLPNLTSTKVSTPPSTAPKPQMSASHIRNKSVTAANRPLDEIGSVRTHKTNPSRHEFSGIGDKIPRSVSAQGHRYGRSIHDNAPPVPGLDGAHNIPRSASAIGSREQKSYNTPPLPSNLQHYRTDSQSTTGHTPSESTSSNRSETSQPNTSSSRSSPPSSPPRIGQATYESPYNRTNRGLGIEPERVLRPAPQSFSRPSYAQPISAVISPGTMQQMSAGPWQAPPRNQTPTVPILSPETFDQVSAGPWGEVKKRAPQPPALNLPSNNSNPYRDNPPHGPTPESPMDPALKGNRLPMLKVQGLPPATPMSDAAMRSAMMPDTRSNDLFNTTPTIRTPQTANPLRRAATVAKGKCRGCSETITGKSVSSADGRLTGRWHKSCFTCKTCSEPFPTMDFYVFENNPYCARHYHRLNKSLCANCDRGIEGQYVDNEAQKFHPHCFTCVKCHLILRDTYFDVGGAIYCERHAFKLDELPPFGAASGGIAAGGARRFPEKRSTRLMMI